MELGKPMALGRTAEIYQWKNGQVLKLFNEGRSFETVFYEARISQAVHAGGAQSPEIGDIITIGSRHGFVMEQIDGATMLAAFKQSPWRVSHWARQFAELHAAMHRCSAPELPSQRQRLQDKIMDAQPLPENLKRAALARLDKLPTGQTVCHGDFHPDNIMLARRGAVIIDWIDATAGYPLADVARTALLVRYGSLPPGQVISLVLASLRALFFRLYLKHYFQLSSGTWKEIYAWLPVVAAGRLDEGIAEEEQNLLRIVQKGLL